MDEKIRENIKHFEGHEDNVTCLECGYQGIMGIQEEIVPWFVQWWMLIPVCLIIFALPFGTIGGVIMGAIFALVRMSITKKKVLCPACEELLLFK